MVQWYYEAILKYFNIASVPFLPLGGQRPMALDGQKIKARFGEQQANCTRNIFI